MDVDSEAGRGDRGRARSRSSLMVVARSGVRGRPTGTTDPLAPPPCWSEVQSCRVVLCPLSCSVGAPRARLSWCSEYNVVLCGRGRWGPARVYCTLLMWSRDARPQFDFPSGVAHPGVNQLELTAAIGGPHARASLAEQPTAYQPHQATSSPAGPQRIVRQTRKARAQTTAARLRERQLSSHSASRWIDIRSTAGRTSPEGRCPWRSRRAGASFAASTRLGPWRGASSSPAMGGVPGRRPWTAACSQLAR